MFAFPWNLDRETEIDAHKNQSTYKNAYTHLSPIGVDSKHLWYAAKCSERIEYFAMENLLSNKSKTKSESKKCTAPWAVCECVCVFASE